MGNISNQQIPKSDFFSFFSVLSTNSRNVFQVETNLDVFFFFD